MCIHTHFFIYIDIKTLKCLGCLFRLFQVHQISLGKNPAAS